MIGLATRVKALAACVLLAGWLSACEHAPDQAFGEPAPVPSPIPVAQVLAAGFATIADRYIEPVSVETVALNGIEGLGALDPGLSVVRREKALELNVGGKTVFHGVLPKSDNAAEWADLTERAWTAGRRHAPGLAAANTEQVYEAVFDAALATLDRHSTYASAEEASTHRTRRYGHDGIGAEFTLDGAIARVTKVNRAGPAAKAGLRAGDWVTHIDAVAVAGLSRPELIDRLGGPAGGWIALTVRRPPARIPERLRMRREHIFGETVATARGHGILYLGVKGFNGGTVGRLWSLLHDAIHGPGAPIKGVILDLRDNPGGLLRPSVRVADLFLDHGPIIATRGRHPDSMRSYQAGGRDVLSALPMVVLIDGGSASAAEIVAAALQDHGRALVIGTASYGKGTVQTVVPLPNNGELSLTWSRLVTPSGRILQGRGVLPTLCTSGVNGGDPSAIARALAGALSRPIRTPREDASRSARGPCPPEIRGTTLEIHMARRVLSDGSLYWALLRPRSAMAQASN